MTSGPAPDLAPVVCVGFAEWDGELWTNQQHLMSRLARDRRVLFIESLGLRRPQLAGRDLRRIARRLVRGLAGPRERDGVLVLSPLVLPFHGNRFVRALNARLLPTLVRRAARRAGIERPVLWAYVPQAEVLVAALRPRAVVYHCVDDIAEQKGIDAVSFRAAEGRFVQRADLVLASAPSLARRLEPAARALRYSPNVADTELFAGALGPGPVDPALAAIPAPRIVFTGAIVGTKLDMGLITDVARHHPDWNVVLVGPVGLGDPSTDVSALRALPNVHLVGGRAYQELPDVLRGAEAAIIPYAINELTRSVFPMKVYEYLAAGLPVIATPLPSLAELDNDIEFAEDADTFAAALEKALANDNPQSRVERSTKAQSHSWDARLVEIDAALRELEEESPARTIVATPFTPTLALGRARRTYGVVKALAAHGPVDLVYQRTGDGRPDDAYLDDPAIRLHPVGGSRGPRRLATFGLAQVAGVPRDFARGIWPELADKVRELDDGRCRVVADGPIAFAALRGLARRRPVIYNAANLESAFRHLLDGGARSEKQMCRFERRIISRSMQAWMVSEADMAGAAALAPGAALRLVPNVVDVSAISPRSAPGGGRNALFVGDFGWEPNRRALDFLLTEVIPALRSRAADVGLVVAGRGSDSFASADPRVELRGFVDDLDALYAEAGCVVVPLRDGGGSPLKFVEALAYGLPVVATPKAAAGLGHLKPGEHFVLAEATGAAMADGILAALEPDTARRLGPAARAVAEQEYSVEALVARVAP